MAQLYFRYSTMNSGKSLEILKIAFNYEEQGKKTLLLTPSIDDRYGIGKITSRIGIQKDAIPIYPNTNIFNIVKKYELIDCVLIDEGNFLTKNHIISLTDIVDILNIPVIVYGLKNDFKNELFEGSKYLLIYADKIEEIKTVCFYCNKKATMIVKFVNNIPIYDGNQIEIGGNDKYRSVCRKCYKEIKNDKE